MPTEITLDGVTYLLVRKDTAGGAVAPARDERNVLDRLATGQPWLLGDIAAASGLKIGAVRKRVGGTLVVAGGEKRKRGRVVRITARSVAKFLGYDLEAARLAGGLR